MIRRATLFVVVAVLMGSVAAVASAQDPAPKVQPTEPVERTAADIEAIRQMDEAGLRATESMTPRDISHITIPARIRVGITPYVNCSDWVLNNRPVTDVIEMDLRDYVKNVLPNEWPNAWPAESLRAGAVAVKMFAWWRINLNAQYPGVFRPEGVDVVDNTCDQVFWPNSNRPTTNAAVDFTWPYRLHYNGFVQEIHFLAYDFQCAQAQATQGGGWFRCLPQWTTKDMADQGASWQVMINQFYTPITISITSDILANTNVIKNPGFNDGLANWQVTGGAQGANVVNGVFNFYRGMSGGAAVLRQDVAALVPASARMKVKLKLGNSSATPKQVTVRLLRPDGGASAATCTFTLPPNAPKQKYLIWGRTPAAWNGVRLEIAGETADNTPAYLVDGVNLTYQPAAAEPEMPCQPPLPGKPVITAPSAGLTYGLEITVNITPGKTNHVAGYSPAFHVQIDDNANFGSPIFDNASELSAEPSVPVTLPSGTWHLRVRQFDGVDRYSKWSASLRFTTRELPQVPTLITPSGDVPADGQSFIWTASASTTLYKLKIFRPNNPKVLVRKIHPEQAGCTTICTYALDAVGINWLTNETYTWRVVGKNAEGKAKSDKIQFSLIP